MNSNKLWLSALLVAAAALAVWVIASQRSDAFPNLSPGKARSDADQAMLDAQSAQNARLDRLEAMIGRIAQKQGLSPAEAAARRQQLEKAKTADQMTPQQKLARLEQRMRKADDAFAAEPVARSWAARNEKMISSAFSAEGLAEKNAPKPRLYDAQCRSKTCRIEVVYDSEPAADEGMLFLLSDIGGALGNSTPFQRTLPDGSVQLILYSTAAPPRTQGPDQH